MVSFSSSRNATTTTCVLRQLLCSSSSSSSRANVLRMESIDSQGRRRNSTTSHIPIRTLLWSCRSTCCASRSSAAVRRCRRQHLFFALRQGKEKRIWQQRRRRRRQIPLVFNPHASSIGRQVDFIEEGGVHVPVTADWRWWCEYM